MELPKYDYKTNDTFASFEFFSEGPNGKIKKLVNYQKIDEWPDGTPVINLGFGDWDEAQHKVSDMSMSNNADRNKILATVASTVIDFTEKHGKLPIFAKGTTPARTRLYQMGINANLSPVRAIFEVYGLTVNGWESFQKSKNYEAFLVIRK
jgi:hypothetical protein